MTQPAAWNGAQTASEHQGSEAPSAAAVDLRLRHVPADELQRLRTLARDVASPSARAAAFAAACRLNALYMIKKAGSGHIGSSFSAMDVVAWLHLEEMAGPDGGLAPECCYFSSKGHDVPGLYAVLIGLGLLDADLLHKLRQRGGLPGHPDVGTPHVPTNTGSLGMGISKAKGMVLADRLTGKPSRVYVLTGDGELQEGQIWESLQQAANRAMHEIVVIVDHNKVQSDTFVANTSDLGDLEAKFTAFGWHVARCDGHDFDALADVFAQFREDKQRPKVLIADTVKGRGVSFMEHTSMPPGEWLFKYHSGAPNDENYMRALAELTDAANGCLEQIEQPPLKLVEVPPTPLPGPKAPQRLVAAYGKALLEAAERDPKLVALDADLMLDCGLQQFREKYNDRFFECGIAEMDMVSMAGGMALKGLFPVVHSFACFLSSRPNEQFYNNDTEHTKILYTASLAGVIPGGPGHSHQAVRDISALRGVPGLVMAEPATEAEVRLAVEFFTRDCPTSGYLRLVSIPVDVPIDLPADYKWQVGRGWVASEGTDAVLFAYGPVLLAEAHKAVHELAKRGHNVRLVNLPWLNRIDRDWLAETVADVRHVFTLDNHYVEGGQGQFLAAELAAAGLLAGGRTVQGRGVDRVPECGRNPEVLAAHGLDAAAIAGWVGGALDAAGRAGARAA